MWAGITITHLVIASSYISRKNPPNMMPGGSALAIHHCRRVLMERHVSITFIATLIRFVTMPLVYEMKNNSDKFYHRRSMWAADETLIINELGPYI